MPNHVLNEIVFADMPVEVRNAILDKCINEKGHVDFEILLPLPLNLWPGSVSTRHEKTFPGTRLDAAKSIWGTKWNAYHQADRDRSEFLNGPLTLVFQSAWRPPYGWIMAVFNTFKPKFVHTWLDEGATRARVGKYDYSFVKNFNGDPWSEDDADDETHRRIHKMMWGR